MKFLVHGMYSYVINICCTAITMIKKSFVHYEHKIDRRISQSKRHYFLYILCILKKFKYSTLLFKWYFPTALRISVSVMTYFVYQDICVGVMSVLCFRICTSHRSECKSPGGLKRNKSKTEIETIGSNKA